MKVKLGREKDKPRYPYLIDGSPVAFVRFYPYLESLLLFPDLYPEYVENTKKKEETPLDYGGFVKQEWENWRLEGIKPVEYFAVRSDRDYLGSDSIDVYAEVEVPEEDSGHLAKLVTKAQDIIEHHWSDDELKLKFYRNECAPILSRIAYLKLKSFS